MLSRIAPLAVAAALGACGGSSTYQFHTDRPMVTVRGEDGAVKVASNGIVTLRVSGNVLSAIHVRMLVDDADGRTFDVDTGDAHVRIPGGGGSSAMFVETGIRGPTIAVGPGEERVIDLYFPLPRGVFTNDLLPSFDFMWSMRTPSHTIYRRTHFDRV